MTDRVKASVGYTWHLPELLTRHGIDTSATLAELLSSRGVHLSPSQVYRLATGTPQRLSLATLAALCDIFTCTPSDLITTRVRLRFDTANENDPMVPSRPIRARIQPP